MTLRQVWTHPLNVSHHCSVVGGLHGHYLKRKLGDQGLYLPNANNQKISTANYHQKDKKQPPDHTEQIAWHGTQR
jgi:hypothetical protein